MGSIYKALMRAAEEREVVRGASALRRIGSAMPEPAGADADEEMAALLQAIESLPVPAGRKIVQFFGSHDGERAGVLARELATRSTEAIGLSVLLVERPGPLIRLDGLAGLASLSRRFQNASAPHAEGEKSAQEPGSRLSLCSMREIQPLWAERNPRTDSQPAVLPFTEPFDLVVIPAGIEAASDSSAICPCADALVLVFESEETAPSRPRAAWDLGLSCILEQIGQGLLVPQQTLSCMGNPILLLTLPSHVPDPAH